MDYLYLMGLGLLTAILLFGMIVFISLIFYQFALSLRRTIRKEPDERYARIYGYLLAFCVIVSAPITVMYALAKHIMEEADNERQIFLEDLQNNLENLYSEEIEDEDED